MDNPNKPDALQELLADLGPEELEPRLELQLFIDPLASLGLVEDTNQNQNQNQNQK